MNRFTSHLAKLVLSFFVGFVIAMFAVEAARSSLILIAGILGIGAGLVLLSFRAKPHINRWVSKSNRNWRGFFIWYKDPEHNDYNRLLDTKLEVSWRKGYSSLGFRFHIGTTYSETPIDVMLGFGFIAFYWSLDFPGLGKACEWIGRGHKRNLSLTFHSGQMWWELWYDDDMGNDTYHRCDSWRRPKLYPWRWGRKKHRSWMCLRNGNIDLNPLDAFWGNSYYSREELEKAQALVDVGQFKDDCYQVELKLEKLDRARKFGPKWVRHKTDAGYTVDWRCEPKGIPVRNHEWKGDAVIASSVGIGYTTEDWQARAIAHIIDQIKRDRRHYNYQPPRVPPAQQAREFFEKHRDHV